MMLCLQCGKEIGDGAKFCPHCGAANAASTPNPAPASDSAAGAGSYTYAYGPSPSYSAGMGGGAPASPPAPPEDNEPPRKKGLLIGGAVAAVAVVAVLLVVLASSLFSSPKGVVEKAVAKSLSAFSEAREEMGLPDVLELTRGKSVSQSFSMELNSINSGLIGYDLSSLQGLGLRLSSDCDWEGRFAGGELAAFWGGNEIASFLMAVNDNVLSFASPQFTGGNAYGLDTETLGADLARLGVEDESVDVSSIGFNLFDLAEQAGYSQQSEGMERKLKEAAKELADAVEVEKAGRKTIDVNGTNVNADAYFVTFPEEALEDYIDALLDAMSMADRTGAMEEILRSIGLDEGSVSGITSSMSGADAYGEVFDALKQALRNMGGLELEVYLDGGYVCAVEYSKEQNGSRLEIGLYLGGGGSYVDDFSLRIAVDNEELLVESTGSHDGGVFTDSTVIRARSGGSTVFRISSNFSYEPKAQSDNFEWSLNLNNMASVKMLGQLTVGKDSFDLCLDDVSLLAAGMEICSLSMDYSVGPYQDGVKGLLPDPTLLGDMDLYDLMDLYYDIEYYAQEWVYDMMAMIPEDLLWAFY